MERLTKPERAFAVAAASLAHDFNNELTIILSDLAEALAALEPGHPARRSLLEARRAAERCASNCNELLRLAEAYGVRPARLPLASLMSLMRPAASSAASYLPALL